jgi:hypothetical protein
MAPSGVLGSHARTGAGVLQPPPAARPPVGDPSPARPPREVGDAFCIPPGGVPVNNEPGTARAGK